MSKIDYQELREKAEKATKGSYIVGHTSVNQHGNLTGVFVCQKWKGEPGGVIAECHVNCLVETDAQAYANAEFIAAFNPNVALALLDERERNQQYIKRRDQENEEIALTVGKLRVELEGKDKLIAELGKQCAEWERKALSNFEECAAMAERIEEMQTKSAPDSFGIIGENIRTQDNRITSDPMFCVYQKREIVVDADYDYDRIVWVDEDGNEANKLQSRRLELLHENFREPPEKWRRVAVKDIDEFVTCCFTEQGCKDYLAVNGHNLRLPFIYVKSGFRNAEYIGIRNWLAGIRIKGE
ncbi:ead/Ea22-like family protein [Escherichia coli]|uniref:ead/Ea22-like family protein n=1 Tax=Escherichia coli TaxID=562 RepID=UPI00050ACE43|nr:ead/Ea22-like family protein [Escherichia coli]EED0101242.1 ead/Ea22-like family protein [Escherichia coli]EED1283613.1 ead/Ea22-like family protein [Escherichia coli]EES2035421.1 ead/Ea22-like family protein [Escherichia coli]EET1923565.1 ead/Ea22-like family protein [Escherichia coli]EEU9289346.1 ead/Ea22-like family protein [Escherichia coli]